MSHFTDAVKFESFNSNDSHDEFAQKIDSFADSSGIESCSIIAHSQGGAAALHLYAHYWSCLDNADSGTRLIQSVGTPYQGTAIAGTAAYLAAAFGVGCGANYDLTYNGAAAWLSTKPSWARAEVFYWTTSFKDYWWSYDYCNFVTDPFLSDPDDGVTEKWAGQLPYGNNRGHKEGFCHTSGMEDGPQLNDYGRNHNEMNLFAG